MKVRVEYAKNKLAGTGSILLEKYSRIIDIESDPSDEKNAREEIKEILCELESLPDKEIKIIGMTSL
ncbi:hypothetical protein [Paenibacillus sp. FSL H3-0333]|uniref:hypothetical protein n=1 Tax=Paenibacillus sp. FSL H3-0333 TaxID=2921373 RepID=UPI0030FBCDB4